jgi:RHS repeat-associated protein
MTNNEMVSFGCEAAGNRMEEQDIPLLVAPSDRGSQAHEDSQPGTPACILWREMDGRLVSVRDVLSMSEQVVETVTYDSFGNLLNDTNAADDGVFRRYDCDPNMLLYQSCTRAYDPTIGRWLSDEPVGFEAGAANLASYVGNESNESNE